MSRRDGCDHHVFRATECAQRDPSPFGGSPLYLPRSDPQTLKNAVFKMGQASRAHLGQCHISESLGLS